MGNNIKNYNNYSEREEELRDIMESSGENLAGGNGDNNGNDDDGDDEPIDTSNMNVFGQGAHQEKSTSPLLDAIGRDFTKMAEEGKIDPIIGRQKEIEQVIWVLSRKNKNNPIIIGEPGVGKTAIVEGIARMIASDDCPEALEGKRIVGIDMGTIMAGTSAQGDLEAKMKQLMKELTVNDDIILFIDEVHMIVNSNLSIDVGNMMKPALARGEMRLIGATTYNEFRTSIEKDGALNRRFQKVNVEPTSVEDTLKILQAIQKNYEEYHNVEYSDDAIKACVSLSDKYITDRVFPDKAIDLMDEVGARIRVTRKKNVPPEIIEVETELHRVREEKDRFIKSEDYEASARSRKREKELLDELSKLGQKYSNEEVSEVNKEDVENVISLKTGIPLNRISKDETERLLNLEKDLSVEIIGQDEAVSKVSKCIRRSRAGLKDPNRPNGVFLFLGSTGVGKTHTVKTLAKHLFNSSNDVIRIDMSEYRGEHNVSRLIGAPPGYVGYGEGGQLTEKVRRKPYSIVLFDEIEKAHPKVLDVLLQVFDDGHLTDGEGRKVDFKNTIIIMTSNIGTSAIDNMIEPVGFGTSASPKKDANVKEIISKELKRELRPEFINRIDDIIIFNSLEKEAIMKIVDNELNKLGKRMEELGYELEVTDSVKEFLMEQGYDEKMGARPLKRAIQKYLEDPIADQIIRKKIEDKVEIDYDSSQKKLIVNGDMINEKIITNFDDYKLLEEKN